MHIRLHNRATIALVAVLCVQSLALAQNRIHYTVTLPSSGRDLTVTITAHAKGTPLRFQIPTWSPGAYIVSNFADSIADVSATDSHGGPVTVTHPDKQTWEISTAGTGDITLRYKVANS